MPSAVLAVPHVFKNMGKGEYRYFLVFSTLRIDSESYDTDWCFLTAFPYSRHSTLVHGSLARAGKVKSQTPKVDKQEKKKVPKGRAKKRILYNRRYVLDIPPPLL